MHKIPRHILSWTAFMFLSVCGYTQSSSYCSNTAMVPVFKQTFDTSPSSSTISLAPPGSTNYTPGNVGTDGRYIVTPRVENAGKGDWTIGGDHTGNINGNMFLVNAGSNKSILLQQTVNDLCSGSSYSFSAWAANVNTSKTSGICGSGLRYPKLTFNIKTLSNVLLATYTTGNLPLSPDNGPVNWQKYGFQFDLPANTSSLRIEIVDAWGGGDACGNDLALDDILFEACIPQITVSLNSSSSNICAGTSAAIQSNLTNSPYTSPAYQWQKSTDGSSWANLGIPVTGTGADQLNFPSTALTDGGLYRVTVAPTVSSLDIATCSAHSNELSFIVNPLPQVAPASNSPLCSGKDLSLKANTSGGSGSYPQYLWTGPASFQSVHADTILPAVQTAATGTYTVSVTDSKGCTASGNLSVQIDSTPVISVSSMTDSICSVAIGQINVSSSVPNSSFYWDANVVAGSVTGNTTTSSPDLSGIQQSTLYNNSTINGAIRYSVYALTTANCSSDTLQPSITVLPNPDTPDAGTDTTICNSAGFHLYGNTPAVGTGAWTQISGPITAVFADSTLAHSAVSNLVPGTYHFVWRISNSCASSADTMTLYYKAPPAPVFVLSDTSICGPASVSFTNNTSNKADYGFSWNFGNGTSSTLSDPAAVLFAPSVSGLDTTYTITLNAFTGCDTATITKTILVKQTPGAGLTVIPQNTCMPTTVQLINQSMGSNTTYRMIFGDGTDSIILATDTVLHVYNAASSTMFQPMIIATNSCGADTATAPFLATADLLNIQTNLSDTAVCGNPYTANFTNTTTGATQFTWTWGDGTPDYTSASAGSVQHVYQDSGTYQINLRILHACGDTTITKTIYVYPAVKSSFSITNSRICAGDSVQFLNQSDMSLQYFWKINNDTVHTFAPHYQFSLPGNYHPALFVSKTFPMLTCADSSQLNIIVDTVPVIQFNQVDDQICAGQVAKISINSALSSVSYFWNNNSSNTSSIQHTTSSAARTMIEIRDSVYAVSANGCISNKLDTVITVQPLPDTAVAGIDTTICTSAGFQLYGNTPLVGTGAWTQISGPNTAVFADSTLAHSAVSNLVPGTYHFVWRISNSCASYADTMILYYKAPPAPAFVLSDTAICGPASVSFTNNTPNKADYGFSWNFGNGNSSSLTDPAAVVFAPSISVLDTTYTITLNAFTGCDTATVTKILLVKQTPRVGLIVTPENTCMPTTVQLINRSMGSNSIYKLLFGDGSDTTVQENDTVLHIYNAASSTTFQPMIIATNSCGADTATASFLATADLLNIQTNLSDTAVCGNPYTANFTNTTTGATRFTWTWGDGTPDYTSASAGSVQHVYQDSGTYQINLHILHACGDTTISKSIRITAMPDNAYSGADTTICNSAGFHLYGNTPAVGTGAWTQISGPNTAVFADSTLAHSAISNLIPGTYHFVWRISNSCASSADTMMLYYKAPPAPAFVLSDTSICGPASVSFTNNTSNKADYGFSWNFGNGTSSTLADPAAVLFAPSVSGLDTTYPITLNAFTGCDTASITKTILVKQKPRAGLTVIPQNTCMPTTVQLINQSLGSNTTYRMVFGDGTDSVVLATDTVLHIYNAANSTTFQPMVIATNSCGADTATAVLQTIANPVNIRLNLQDTAVCGAPFELSFLNNSTGISQFNWNWGDGTTSTTTDTGIVRHKYLQPGVYKLSIAVSGVCGDTLITKNIHVYPAVKAAFDTISANNCIGDSIQFKSLSGNSLQLQWNINNAAVSNLQEFNFAFNQSGIFPVQLIASQVNPFKTCSDTSSRNIHIIAVQPGKGSITPLYGNCVPFVVQLTNQTNQPTSSVQWLVSNGETTSGNSASFTFNQSGTYKVIMQARNAGGCTFVDSATIQIKSPAGTIQYKGGPYCSPNSPISFTPEVSNTDSIEWNFGDGTILTTSVRTIKHQYKQQGIFRPVFTLISNTGCRIPVRNTDSIVVEVVKAGFSVNTVFECGTTTFHFKDSSTSLNGIRNHYWRVNSLPAGNGRSATASFKRKGAQLTELTIESNFGCTDNIRGAYTVGIYNFPQVHINSINEACLNNLMELKSNIHSTDSVIYRLWNLGNGQSATDSAVKVLYYDEGVYTVKLTASTVNTCYDSAIKQIAIHALPAINIAKEKNICPGDSIVLRVDGTANYVWKDQQNNMICNNCNSITVRPQESTQYQVIGYNQYGCSNVASTSVKVIAPAKIQVSPESVLCEGSSVRIWASGVSSYQWLPAPGLTNHNAAAPVVSPRVTTTYKVIGKDPYNCITDTAYTRVVVGKPTPVSVGKDTSFIAGAKIRLRAEVATNNIVQWKWSGGADLSCVFCPEPVARVVNDENIACTVTNEFGCITSDTLKIRTFCPGAEVFIPNAFSPDGDGRNDWLYVQAKGIKLVKNFRVYSRWGELVFEKLNSLPNDPTAGWNGRIRGNLANPDIYVYVCEVICEKGTPQLYKGNVAIIK
ncbi:MAG: PKD domain-containing protein [Sediminibacterium sp.]|nr:PKD domain-containing protein [Sediminibacterium sp.]